MRIATRLGVLLGAFSLGGCVFYPQRVEVYDAECRVTTHKLELEVAVIDNLDACHGEKAEVCLAAIVAIGGATAVISGSIVIAGNTLYWLERQGACRNDFT